MEDPTKLCDSVRVDTFVCELTRIDRLGSNRRLIFTVPSVDAPGWKDIVIKMVVSADYMVQLGYIIANDGDQLPDMPSIFSASGQAN